MKSTSLPFSAQPPSDTAPDRPAQADAASTDWRAVAAVFGAGLIAALQVGKTAIALPRCAPTSAWTCAPAAG
nr:hypothetical protein [Lysobacter enzymogenes]